MCDEQPDGVPAVDELRLSAEAWQVKDRLQDRVAELERLAQRVAEVHVGPGRVYDFDKLSGAIVLARAVLADGVTGGQAPSKE